MLHGHLFATATPSILNERCISEFGTKIRRDDGCDSPCAKHLTILTSGFWFLTSDNYSS